MMTPVRVAASAATMAARGASAARRVVRRIPGVGRVLRHGSGVGVLLLGFAALQDQSRARDERIQAMLAGLPAPERRSFWVDHVGGTAGQAFVDTAAFGV